jgi:catechol 2,3-dioxygenase-like lactoylglutathione lyase family enzyme
MRVTSVIVDTGIFGVLDAGVLEMLRIVKLLWYQQPSARSRAYQEARAAPKESSGAGRAGGGGAGFPLTALGAWASLKQHQGAAPDRGGIVSGGGIQVGQSISAVALLVRDYDEALRFYTECLRFTVVEDTPLDGGKRWVVVRPASGGPALVLARAANPDQAARVGDQTGGRVFLFLHTDDFWRDHRDMLSRGVRFVEGPRDEPYGTVAVFLDLYGNRWDLVQPRNNA